MKSKWSKVIKSESRLLAVESFQMSELIPFSPVYRGQPENIIEEEPEPEPEPPHDCSVLQQQAFESGREAGIQEGQVQCRSEIDREMHRVFLLVEQLGGARADMVVKMETALVELAFAVARKVIQCEVSVNNEIVADYIRPILQSLSTTGGVCLKVHPDEVEHIQAVQSRFVGRDGETLALRVEEDDTVGIGGCTIHTDGLDIDASLDQQLHRLHDVLASQKEPHGSHVPSSSS